MRLSERAQVTPSGVRVCLSWHTGLRFRGGGFQSAPDPFQFLPGNFRDQSMPEPDEPDCGNDAAGFPYRQFVKGQLPVIKLRPDGGIRLVVVQVPAPVSEVEAV